MNESAILCFPMPLFATSNSLHVNDSKFISYIKRKYNFVRHNGKYVIYNKLTGSGIENIQRLQLYHLQFTITIIFPTNCCHINTYLINNDNLQDLQYNLLNFLLLWDD